VTWKDIASWAEYDAALNPATPAQPAKPKKLQPA